MKNTCPSNSLKTGTETLNSIDCTTTKNESNIAKENQEDFKEPVLKRRYVVTFVSFLVYLFTHIQRTVMSVLIVAMVNNTAIDQNTKAESESCLEFINNSTEDNPYGLKTEGELLWSPQMQGYILGSLYVGQILVQIPASRLCERYGCKRFIVVPTLVSSILTVLIPPFSFISAYAVICIQIIRGVAMGVTVPSISVLISNWSPKCERGVLFSITMSSIPLGQVLGSLIAGYVSELPGGWMYAYYTVGGPGILLAIYVLFFITEIPSEDRFISKGELNFILSGQENTLSRKRPKLPWRQLLTSVPVYALIFGVFGRMWALLQFSVVHATFLGTILHYPMGQNGLFTAMPNLFSFVTSHISAWISLYIQKKTAVSVDFLRKFWTFISSLGYSLCLLGVYIVGCDRNLSVILSTLSMALHGLGSVGCAVSSQDMSPTFAGTLHSIGFTVGFLAGVVFPVLVGFLTDETRTLEQWNKVFFISIGIVMSSAIAFAIFGSAKIQPWNFVEDKDEKNVEKTNERNQEKEKDEEMTKF